MPNIERNTNSTGEITRKKAASMGCVLLFVPPSLMAAGAYAGSQALQEQEDPVRCAAAVVGGGLGFLFGAISAAAINSEIHRNTLHL